MFVCLRTLVATPSIHESGSWQISVIRSTSSAVGGRSTSPSSPNDAGSCRASPTDSPSFRAKSRHHATNAGGGPSPVHQQQGVFYRWYQSTALGQ